MVISRRSIGTACAKAALLALSLALALPPAAAVSLPNQQPDLVIAFSKDAYWYRPGDTARLKITIKNRSRQDARNVTVRVRFFPALRTRSALDECFEGRMPRTARLTETVASGVTLQSGDKVFEKGVFLSAGRFNDGVYPMCIEALKAGEKVASANGSLVVMPPLASEAKPLRLSLVLQTAEPSHRSAEGHFKGEELARECGNEEESPGWWPGMLGELEKAQSMHFTVALSPMLIDELHDMSDGYTVRRGEKTEKVQPESEKSRAALEVLNAFRRMATDPRYQLVQVPYASPDLEKLIGLRWREDALRQISRGNKVLKDLLPHNINKEYGCPPGLLANSRVARELGGELGNLLMLSGGLLERSVEGRKLAQGYTLGNPVEIAGSKGVTTLSVFTDTRLQELIGKVRGSEDPHGVAQYILSELTNLYLERPGKDRLCAVEWPSWWRPSRWVVQEVMKALGAPWLSSVTLAEGFAAVPPLENSPLEIPEPQRSSDEYFSQVARARDLYERFSNIVLEDNPLLPALRLDLWTSQSIVWQQWDRALEGLTYSGAVLSRIEGELKKVSIPAVSSITLTSGKAEIPLTIINGTTYRVRAVLKLSSNGLSFPGGPARGITLQPKENNVSIAVVARKKGRVRFWARLVGNGLILGEVDMAVLTSRFNTFAFMLVAGLLCFIGAGWAWRIISRRKVGKHKRRQLEQQRSS